MEREEISRGLAAELSHRMIVARLNRSQSVVSREVERNGGDSGYRAVDAQERADGQRRRPKVCKLVARRRLHDAVARRRADDYSPQQVSESLRKDFPDHPERRVSHATT